MMLLLVVRERSTYITAKQSLAITKNFRSAFLLVVSELAGSIQVLGVNRNKGLEQLVPRSSKLLKRWPSLYLHHGPV